MLSFVSATVRRVAEQRDELDASARGVRTRVRLSRPELAADLAEYLTTRGFPRIETRSPRDRTPPANPVSACYDRARAENVVNEWAALNGERFEGNPPELI